MAETALQKVQRIYREFKRFTGDGLPNEPVGAPLPVGDPASGVWNPKKADIREAETAVLTGAEQSASAANTDATRAETAAATASAVMTTVLDPQFATLAAAQAYSPTVAPDYIRTAGYTTAGDGGGALYKKVASEPTHAGKFSITLDDGVTVVWYEMAPEDGVYRARAFGLVSDLLGNDGLGTGTVSGADQTVALEAMFDAVPSGVTIDFGSLRIRFTTNIYIDKDIDLRGNGDAVLYGDGAILYDRGSLTEIGYVSSAADKGDKAIALSSVAGLSANDVIIVHNQNDYSFGPHRAQYHQGEFNEIREISGSTLTLKNALRASYPAGATIKVFKLNPVRFTTKGVKYEGTGAFVLRIEKGMNCRFDAHVGGGTAHALSISTSYETEISAGRYEHVAPAVSNNYGISVSNSQGGYIAPGVYAFGTRHPISLGGGVGDGIVPCRDWIIDRVEMANSVDNIYAADFHGNVEDCYYIECRIDGGVGLAGKNVGAINCKVNGRGNIRPLLYHELAGGTCDFDGCEVTLSDTFSATGIVGVAASSLTEQITENFAVKADDLTVHMRSGLAYVGTPFNNAVGTVKWSFSMRNLLILGDRSGLTALVNPTIVAPGAVATEILIDGAQCPAQPLTRALAKPALTGSGWSATKFALPEFASNVTLGRVVYLSSGDAIYKGKQTESIAVTTASGPLYVSAQRALSVPVDWVSVDAAAIAISVGWAVSVVADLSNVTYYAAHTASGTISRTVNFEINGKWFDPA